MAKLFHFNVRYERQKLPFLGGDLQHKAMEHLMTIMSKSPTGNRDMWRKECATTWGGILTPNYINDLIEILVHAFHHVAYTILQHGTQGDIRTHMRDLGVTKDGSVFDISLLVHWLEWQ